VSATNSTTPLVLAFYLPQFHPIPENDEWWGPGFTEWRFVADTRPLFPGHEQPRLPADLGYYDLRVPEARRAQADLARAYGIDAFCYYHYWFGGRRLLGRPLDEVLATGEPDFPFCLCWANESWTRTWRDAERGVLIEQTYSDADDGAHAEFLAAAFADPRYLKCGGRPVFVIYRPLDLPNPTATIAAIKETATRRGLAEPLLLGANARAPWHDFRALGFDGTLDWQPKLGFLGRRALLLDWRLSRGLRNLARARRFRPRLELLAEAEGRRRMAYQTPRPGLVPSVLVGWDNSPRLGDRAIVLTERSPDRFESELVAALERARDLDKSQRMVFLFAWNEWGEGAYLEPDGRFGRGYLEAVARAVLAARPAAEAAP
jgi:lipopolysaccharide biosynthesis protein